MKKKILIAGIIIVIGIIIYLIMGLKKDRDDGSMRLGYSLTEKGRSLGPVLEAMRDWGLKWEPATKAMMR